MAEILLIEDDETLGMSLEYSLEARGHSIKRCTTLESGRSSAQVNPPDLILLDLGLPDGDGLELCQELRESGNIAPILILTARGTLNARIDGLDSGADDYVAKPFDLQEILARVEALLRRQRWHGRAEQIQIGRLRVDFRRYEATCNGEPVPLTELEFKLLRYLLEKDGKAATRDELLLRVWNQTPKLRTRTVDVFMSRLRKFLEEDSSNPQHLINVRGVGYKLRV